MHQTRPIEPLPSPISPCLIDPTQPLSPISLGLAGLCIGRAFDNDFVVLHESVAEHHCHIERQGATLVIKGLQTGQSTRVNGTEIIAAYLKEGDEIGIGEKVYYFLQDFKSIGSSTFGLASKSPKWQRQLDLLKSVSETDFPILLLGASGTGKEIIAEAVHEASERSRGPLVKVNCSALTESLIESELFGHIKGSFTGATSDRKGAFETARKGTLFLDEIGELPLSAQAKLLRALENKEVRAVGSDRTIRTDVRILAATHPNLMHKVRDGRFREDLYFRLNVVTIQTPRLIDRIEDFDDILNSFCKPLKVKFATQAVDSLKAYSWPGNIRELKNLVSKASAMFPQKVILHSHLEELMTGLTFSSMPEAEHFSNSLFMAQSSQNLPGPRPAGLSESAINRAYSSRPSHRSNGLLTPGALPMIKQLEKQLIIRHLIQNKGNQRKAATQMGIPKSTLFDRIKTYNIDPRQYESV